MSLDTYLAPTTELEAVNEMLRSIGETPVNSLENLQVIDASIALSTLRGVSREVQAKGWHFNTEDNYPLALDEDGYVQLPANTLRVDTVYTSASVDAIQRGTRLYDKVNHTYVFDTAPTVELVLMLAFDEMPESARQYIFMRAARRFQDRVVGSDVLHQFQANDEFMALALLETAESNTADHNILTGTWGVFKTIHRRFV